MKRLDHDRTRACTLVVLPASGILVPLAKRISAATHRQVATRLTRRNAQLIAKAISHESWKRRLSRLDRTGDCAVLVDGRTRATLGKLVHQAVPVGVQLNIVRRLDLPASRGGIRSRLAFSILSEIYRRGRR